jgi:tetratricopeptide (TPR) repeat protein
MNMGAPEAELVPTASEIQTQLLRILASDQFRRRDRDAEVLRHLVNMALQGKTLMEKDIRKELFPGPYKPTGTNVRTHINFVRKFLRQYYRDEGAQDIVLISMPVRFSAKAPRGIEAKSYPVVFSYNRDLPSLMMGRIHIAQLAPEHIRTALRAFEAVLSRTPDHVAASIGKVQCLCIAAIYLSDSKSRRLLLEEATSIANLVLHNNPDYWAAHIALAAALLCSRHVYEASLAFRKALALDLNNASQSFWIPALFLADNTAVSALEESHRIGNERLGDFLSYAAHGFYLYFARQFQESERYFSHVINTAGNPWIGHLGLAFTNLAQGRPKEAMDNYSKAQELTNYPEPLMPGVGLLAFFRAPPEDTQVPSLLRVHGAYLLHFPDEGKDWIQIALTAMELNPERAVRALKLAAYFSHPLVLLLPVWPIFDPLRDRQDFQELLKNIDLHSADDKTS